MAIMKLSNVPELTEFTGTEKIYVNDNGETKQIACDKVVTAGVGGGVFIIDSTADDYSESDHVYGNKVRDAFLNGMVIYYYDGYSTYWMPTDFTINTYPDENYMTIKIRTINRDGSGGITSGSNWGHTYQADLV